jgi:hypothetical protein
MNGSLKLKKLTTSAMTGSWEDEATFSAEVSLLDKRFVSGRWFSSFKRRLLDS